MSGDRIPRRPERNVPDGIRARLLRVKLECAISDTLEMVDLCKLDSSRQYLMDAAKALKVVVTLEEVTI